MPVSKTTVDFIFDVVCPYAYLAHTLVNDLAQEAPATIRWRPMLLGGLFREVGAGDGPMPTMSRNRARLNLLDMHRWADHFDVKLSMPESHPMRTVLAMRTIVAAGDDVEVAARALFHAYWVNNVDVTSKKVVAETLSNANLDGNNLVERAAEQPTKDELRRLTSQAAAAGAFGAPSFVVTRPGDDPELYWGQDRLHQVRRAISAPLAAPLDPARGGAK